MEEEIVKVGYGSITFTKTTWENFATQLELEYEIHGSYGYHDIISHDISREEAVELVKLLEKFIEESK